MKEITVKEVMAFAEESRFKNALEFKKKYDAIMDEIKVIKERKASAAAKIEELNKELSTVVTEVDEILNPLKRKKVLDTNRKLKEQLEEEEMFLNLDIDTYKNKKLDELLPLAELVKKDNATFGWERGEFYNRLREEHTFKENIIHSTNINTHIQTHMGRLAHEMITDKERRDRPVINQQGKYQTVYRMIDGKQVKVGEEFIPY